MAKLLNLCENEHLASDLEIMIQNSDDKFLGRLYSYQGFIKVRVPKLAN